MGKLNLEAGLYARAVTAAESAGYSSVDEFVAHCIELELARRRSDEAESHVADQLRGLGYIQ